jgi:hypothetical protein
MCDGWRDTDIYELMSDPTSLTRRNYVVVAILISLLSKKVPGPQLLNQCRRTAILVSNIHYNTTSRIRQLESCSLVAVLGNLSTYVKTAAGSWLVFVNDRSSAIMISHSIPYVG